VASSQFKIEDLTISVSSTSGDTGSDITIKGQDTSYEGGLGGNVVIIGGNAAGGGQGGSVKIVANDGAGSVDFSYMLYDGGTLQLVSQIPTVFPNITMYNSTFTTYLSFIEVAARVAGFSCHTNDNNGTQAPAFQLAPKVVAIALTGNSNPYILPGWAYDYHLTASSPAVIQSLMSSGAGLNDVRFRIRNVGANTITLTHMYALSPTLQEKMWCAGAADIVLAQYEAAEFHFNTTSGVFGFYVHKL
jgi:hypothetical protein